MNKREPLIVQIPTVLQRIFEARAKALTDQQRILLELGEAKPEGVLLRGNQNQVARRLADRGLGWRQAQPGGFIFIISSDGKRALKILRAGASA